MPISSNIKASTAFKNLLGKAQTDDSKEIGNEALPNSLNIHANTIFIDQIDSIPSNAVSAGVAVFVQADLILDNTSNGHAYIAKWPSTPPSGIDPITSLSFAYGVGSLTGISAGDRIENAISYQYGDLYEAKPFDTGSNPIPVADPRDWIYQYQNGVFYQQDVLTPNPSTIEIYVYIGNFLSDQNFDVAWDIIPGSPNNDAQLLVTGDVLPNTNDTNNLGRDLLRWKEIFLSEGIDYNISLKFKENGVERISIVNDKLGINQTSPSAYLHIGPGSSTVAQLKLDPGSLLSVEQDGTFEYDGNVLYFTIGSTRFDVLLSGSPTTTLDDLSDVTLTSPLIGGDVLIYNGSTWTNSQLYLDDLADVVITTPTTGQILSYNGTEWENSDFINGIKYHLVNGDNIEVTLNYQYFVYGNLTIDAGATLTNYGQVIIINGGLINNGTFNNFGTLLNVTLAQGVNKKYKATFTATANIPFIVSHNLNTLDFVYTVREGNDDATVQLTRIDANNVQIVSTVNMTGDITIIGY